jgi:dipeptidyl aminopeptidase/acylaminoacyl peptidase
MKKLLLATCVALVTFVAAVPANQAVVRRFGFDDFSKVKRVSDPQFSPDGSTLAYLVSTPNLDENRHVSSLHRMPVSGGNSQLVVDGAKYVSVSFPRWSPNGQQIAFLSTGPVPGQPGAQIFVVSSKGGDVKQLTTAASGVQQLAWSPDGATIGFATADVPEKKPGYQRWNDSFEVQLNFHLFMTAPVPPTHVWIVPAAGGASRRLTSGDWTLPVTRPPGAPSSMIHVDARRLRHCLCA